MLDRRRIALRVERQRAALHLLRARTGEEVVELGPLRRDPRLVAQQPDLRVVAEMGDLAGDVLRELRTPLAALTVLGELMGVTAVAHKKALREVEQRLPELVLDLAGAIRVLDVLRGQVAAQRLGARVEVEQRRQPRQRALGAAVGRAAQRGHHLGVNGERVAAGERGQPAFGRLRVDQGVFRGFPKSEHPSRPARGAFRVRRSCGRAVAAAAFEAIAWSRRTRADDCGMASVADDPERPMMAQTLGRGNRRARMCCCEDGSRRGRRHGDDRPPRANPDGAGAAGRSLPAMTPKVPRQQLAHIVRGTHRAAQNATPVRVPKAARALRAVRE